MARPRKQKTETEAKESTLLDKVKMEKSQDRQSDAEILASMPLETLADYVRYNEKARSINKRLRVCRYPVKQCPVELHPHQRIIFQRKDQPKNPLPVYLSDEMIEFKMTLYPGKAYDLPLYVIDYLAEKGTPIWERKELPDGSYETFKVATDPRFALRFAH